MTLLAKIFRPWDLASNETFVAKSNEQHESVGDIIPTDESERSSSTTVSTEKINSAIRKKSSQPSDIHVPETETKNCGKFSESRLPNLALNATKLEDSCNSRSSGNGISHLLELNHASVSPFYLPSSPVTASPTSSNFMSSSSINELASLSRSELTAMGLLPPEPPASMKVKRQRPKRFRCPHCQVAFSNNGQLRGHIRIHTGERPFACEHEGCGKSFTRNEELTRHRRIHTGLRPYPCTHCGKKFGRKDHLKKHTRTHQRPMYNTSSGMIGLGNPFHPFNPSLIPSHSAITEFSSTPSPYALPFMLSIPPPISHFPYS